MWLVCLVERLERFDEEGGRRSSRRRREYEDEVGRGWKEERVASDNL